jgi:hypothetical protein
MSEPCPTIFCAHDGAIGPVGPELSLDCESIELIFTLRSCEGRRGAFVNAVTEGPLMFMPVFIPAAVDVLGDMLVVDNPAIWSEPADERANGFGRWNSSGLSPFFGLLPLSA